jgi:hypothetical protein
MHKKKNEDRLFPYFDEFVGIKIRRYFILYKSYKRWISFKDRFSFLVCKDIIYSVYLFHLPYIILYNLITRRLLIFRGDFR